MAPRKRAAPPPATAASARQSRNERARRRTVARDLAFRNQITELNAVRSPLLRLPAELRNKIYTYVFSNKRWNFTDDIDYLGRFRPTSFRQSNLGLLITSRQVHAETALLPYKHGRFSFSSKYIETDQTWVYVQDQFLAERSEAQLEAIVNLAVRWVDDNLGEVMYDCGTGRYWEEKLEWIREG